MDEGERLELGRCDWLAGRPLLEPLVGTAQGIDRDGALLVDTAANGVERILGGTVVAA
jgi:hypothetical protein